VRNVDNKQKQMAIIGGSVAAVAVVGVLAYTMMSGGSEAENPAPAPAATAGGTSPDMGATPAAGAGGSAGMASGGGASMGAPAPAQAAGGVFSNTPGAAPGTPGAAGKTVVSAGLPFNPRTDPTKIPWTIPPPPPNIFAEVQPLRVATYNVVTPPPPNTEIREVPLRRVSGIMSGDGVFAIIDNGGDDQEIVKPGMETKDGYKVVSITQDSVKLQKTEGNIIRTQIVPLSDISTNPSAGGGAFGGSAGGSMGGAPNFGGGGAGLSRGRGGGGAAGSAVGD
jgi:hypothetical protein